MKRKDLELVEHLSTLDNTSLEQIAMNFSKIVDKRKKNLSMALTHKDLCAIMELSPFFRNDYLPINAEKILSQLDYSIKDREFINYILIPSNYCFTASQKDKTLYQYLSHCLKDVDFYHKVKNDFPQETRGFIKTKFAKDGLKDVNADIFLDLVQSCDLKVSFSDFKQYVENDSLPVLKTIVESGVFTKFLTINHEKIKDLALFYYQEESAQFLIDTYNLEKKVSFFFSDDTSAENFCKNSKIEFFSYVLDNFDFENDQKYTMYFMHHLGKTKSEEKWKVGIDCLVKNHINNPDFIEQVKRKIEISKIEEYKNVARIQFEHSFLDASLPPKQESSKQIKI